MIAARVRATTKPETSGATGHAARSTVRTANHPRPSGLSADFSELAVFSSRGGATAVGGGGRSLPASVQAELGPAFGRDLGGVRIHTDATADAAAEAVGARAFTLGSHIAFAAGEFAPETREGRRLLAHELAHYVQQGGRTDRLQRALKVNAPASDDKKTAIGEMTPLLQGICPDFDVDAKSGVVSAKKASLCADGDIDGVAGGTRPLGCCCLCTLVKAKAQWHIVVTIKGAPSTSPGIVKMTPTTGQSVPDLRVWTAGPTERMVSLTPAAALGHELCGHAALMQIAAHPPGETNKTRRTFSDIHDPTVKIENALGAEMGLGLPARGLAGAGAAHRGESLRVFAIGPFAKDSDTIPASATKALDGAIAFADAKGQENKLIDVVGFNDNSDTVAGIGKSRADEVKKKLESKMKKKADIKFPNPPGTKPAIVSIPRFQPTVDGGLGGAPAVEIRLAREPSGLVAMPAGMSLGTPLHVKPQFPKVVNPVVAGKAGKDACQTLLIKTAWT